MKRVSVRNVIAVLANARCLRKLGSMGLRSVSPATRNLGFVAGMEAQTFAARVALENRKPLKNLERNGEVMPHDEAVEKAKEIINGYKADGGEISSLYLKSAGSNLTERIAQAIVEASGVLVEGFQDEGFNASEYWEANDKEYIKKQDEKIKYLESEVEALRDALETVSFGTDGDPKVWTVESLQAIIREMVRVAKNALTQPVKEKK
jgi:hypothetical protein